MKTHVNDCAPPRAADLLNAVTVAAKEYATAAAAHPDHLDCAAAIAVFKALAAYQAAKAKAGINDGWQTEEAM